MEIIIDAIVILILLSSILLGYKKGLVNVGFNLIAVFISLILTVALYSPITQLIIDNTQIDENIEKMIIENLSTEQIANSENSENSGINSYIQNYAQDVTIQAQNTAAETAAKPIAKNVVGIGVMLFLFIAIRILLTVLKVFTNIMAKLPILKQCNEIAGIIYGLLRGLIIVYICLAIVFFAVPISGAMGIDTIIEDSFVTRFFYNNNIILKLLF